MRLDRSRRRQDIWLGEKMIFFAIGAALGLGGIVTGHDWLVWAAIVVLLIGFVLRLMARRGNGGADHADDVDGAGGHGLREGDTGDDLPPPEERDGDWARNWEEQGEDEGGGEGKDPGRTP